MRAEGQRLFGGSSSGSASRDPAADTTDTPGATSKSRPPARTAKKPKPGDAADAGAWTIAVDFVSGPDHERIAAQRRFMLASQLGREDIEVRSRSGGSALVMGSYESAEDMRAQQDLEWVRSVVVANTRPYARAYMLPPGTEGTSGEHEAWNLATVRERREGAGKALTLQVAVFDGTADLMRARTQAETFAATLRRSGEQAYYFHGPTLSVVTVGLFAASEADATGAPASRATMEAKRAHPLNLKDGTEPILDLRGTPQPSALMRIP